MWDFQSLVTSWSCGPYVILLIKMIVVNPYSDYCQGDGIMLKKIESAQTQSLSTARSQYPKSKMIFIISDMSDMSDIKGSVFMVSDDDASFDELCGEDQKLREKGLQTIIAGSYENGGAIGVQYQV